MTEHIETIREVLPTVPNLIDRARGLRHEGFTVLAAYCPQGHWVGYSVFRESVSYLLTCEESLAGVDLMLVYQHH